jgi:hypothetical protein
MNIEDRAGIRLEERWADHSHVARQTHKTDVPSAKLTRQSAIVVVA